MKGGGWSLYLDINYGGRRRAEFLKMYLTDGRDAVSRRRDARVLEDARIVQARRTLELSERGLGIARPARSPLFLDFAEEYLSGVAGSRSVSTAGIYRCALAVWRDFAGDGVRLSGMDARTYRDFIGHLAGTGLKKTTQALYLSKIATILGEAVRRGLIPENPASRMAPGEKPRGESAERQYLTADELRRIAATPADNVTAKRMFLFACFTGLRFSDVVRVTWAMVDGGEVVLRQRKTDSTVRVPLSRNALSVLPRERSGEYVFGDRMDHARVNYALRGLVRDAGIGKHITFHCARHTFATLELACGVDLYTVSKLLGHADLSTTQIYAKIMDSRRREAVDAIPDIGIRE